VLYLFQHELLLLLLTHTHTQTVSPCQKRSKSFEFDSSKLLLDLECDHAHDTAAHLSPWHEVRREHISVQAVAQRVHTLAGSQLGQYLGMCPGVFAHASIRRAWVVP
jgi:hypothetical protein